MPTYDYECGSCGHRFEVFQSMSDEPIKRCPECGKKVRRLIGGGLGVIFKGSGFYVTDNKRNGNGSADRQTAKTGGDDSQTTSSDKAGSKNGNEAVKGGDGSEKPSKPKDAGAAVKDPA